MQATENMKKAIMPYVARCISSDQLLSARRNIYAVKRKALRQEPVLDIFLKADDPYSYLLIQALESFRSRFTIKLRFHVFYDIDPVMYPKFEMWRKYARYDAYYLAKLYGFHFPNNDSLPVQDEQTTKQLALRLVEIENDDDFIVKANVLLRHFWCHSQPTSPSFDNYNKAELRLSNNQSLLAQKGHYLGAMIYFEGEWYWGLDRLDHLENRLIEIGLTFAPNEHPKFNRTYQDFCKAPLLDVSRYEDKTPLVLYWSARSPYSYLGLERAVHLADHYQMPLVIKPVLPMMMRGMNVPEAKKMYIFLDTKREARKLGIPYGFVADPLGAAVERCYALVQYAQSENKLQGFLLSFARGVNAEGIRAETDRGLEKIVTRSGLNWSVAKTKLSDISWRQWAQANLDEMFAMGCWGVPSIRYGETHFWGQDRFGMIEVAIKKDLEKAATCLKNSGST